MPKIRIIPAPGLRHIAVTDDHHESLLDYALWYPGQSDEFGDIHYGIVTARLPALGGVFVLLHHNRSGFLSDKAGAKNLNEGDRLAVRIIRSAQGDKNVRLDARNLEKYAHTPLKHSQLIAKGNSPLEEMAQRWENAPILYDPLLVHEIPPALQERSQIVNTPVSSLLFDQIEALKEPQVALPLGIQASITPTPALTAIDMDSMGFSNSKQPKLQAQFQANRLALPSLLHQLRLRNLSGAIFLDLIGLPIKKRRLLQQDIENILAKDPLSPKLLGFTHLGLAEIVRPKKRPALHELLNSAHGQAIQLLGHVARDLRTLQNPYQYRKTILNMNINLYQALLQDPWAIKDFERQCSTPLQLTSNPAFTQQQWECSYE